MRGSVFIVVFVLAASDVMGAGAASPAPAASPGSAPAGLKDFNLPAPFARLVMDRAIIDAYQGTNHQVEAGLEPAPNTAFLIRNREGRFVRVVRAEPGEAVLKYRASLPAQFVPLRGFRAPILERAGERPPAVLPTNGFTQAAQSAARQLAQRLAYDGLLPTLAQAVETLGPSLFLTNPVAGLTRLSQIGFPADLLASFGGSDGGDHELNRASNVLQQVARRLTEGATAAALKGELAAIPFRFLRANTDFQVTTESGEHELGMLRVQAGGGYSGGVVPGASIDVISQLVNALPGTDFLISIPLPMLEPFRQSIVRSWRLRRPGQVTLVGEPLIVAAWAQDNGKAGLVTRPAPGSSTLGVLTPRYACIDEGESRCEIGESFLMDGLRAAGHVVAQSSLLFQGGNVMAARDPRSGQRLLLVGEGELYRNIALGLTREQVLEAFRAEFGVDRCMVLSAVSYHLDFDVCLRARADGMVAFVNDNLAAARLILGLGIDALARQGALETNAARSARAELAAGRDSELLVRLTNVVQRQRGTRGFPASLSAFFVADKLDSAAGNLQTFLLALDLLESSMSPGNVIGSEPGRAGYLAALRRMEAARRAQAEELRGLGWTVVAVPSTSDLYRGISYVNGIQHRDGYIMPVFGGFYSALDQAAVAAFRQTLGADFKLTPIQSAECQRAHGGVHCTAAAYPRL